MDVRELGYAILPPPRHPLWGNVVIVEMYFIFKYAFWGKIVRRDKAFSIGESFVRCTGFSESLYQNCHYNKLGRFLQYCMFESVLSVLLLTLN